MKRFTLSLLICSFLLLPASQSFAQEIAAHSITTALPFAGSDAQKSTVAASAILSNPDAKLTHALARSFPATAQQQWWQYKEGFYVQFLNNNRKARAVFNKKGILQYAITDCSAEQLPETFRKKIEQAYPGYTLLHAVEITAHDAVAHQAVIENEKGYITLKGTSDQIEEIDTKTK